MTEQLVNIASFQFLTEAEISKLHLESEGFSVFLSDAEAVNTDWFLAAALGGIKLQVPRSQAEAAVKLLEELRAVRKQHEAHATGAEPEVCLACGAQLPADTARCPACGWTYEDSGPPAP